MSGGAFLLFRIRWIFALLTLGTLRQMMTRTNLRPHRGRTPSVDPTAFIDQSAQVIGAVTIGARSSVWMNAVLRGDVHTISVGEETNIQDGAVLHGMKDLHSVVVGHRCTVGHNATVHGCTLDDDVLVGMGGNNSERRADWSGVDCGRWSAGT